MNAGLATRDVAQDKQEDLASIEKMLQQVAEYKQLVASPERAETTPLAAAMATLAQERLMVQSFSAEWSCSASFWFQGTTPCHTMRVAALGRICLPTSQATLILLMVASL